MSALQRVTRRLWQEPHLRWVLALFLLAFALRAAWVMAVNPDPLPRNPFDAAFYYSAGLGLAQGEGYRDLDGQATNYFPPGYPLVLAGSYLLFGDDLLVGKLVNAFFGAATVVVVYALASRVANRRVGLVAAGVMALYPSQIVFSTVLMTESFFVFLVALSLLLIVLWMVDSQPSNWQLLALGALLGFMTLIRAEAMLLVVALPVLWKVLTPSWRVLGRWMALLLLGVLPVLLFWSMRNYVELGNVEVRSGGSTALHRGLSPDFDFQLTAAFLHTEPPSLEDTFRHYATHPWDVGVVAIRKWAYLFASESDAVSFIQQHVPAPLSPEAGARWSDLVNWYYYAAGALAVVGIALWLPNLDKRRSVLLWFLGSWGATYLLVVPQGRYHFPVIPVLAIIAAFALVHGWQFAREGGLARALAALPFGRQAGALRPASRRSAEAAPNHPEQVWVSPPRPPRGPRAAAVGGFLLLVLAIAVVIGQGFPDPIARLRDARRYVDILALGDAVSAYYDDFGEFPSTGGVEEIEPFCVSDSDKACEFREEFLEVWDEAQFRVDPLGKPETNGYWYGSDGQTAVVYALRDTDGSWAGPRCPLTPPALAGKGDLQCVRLPSTPSATGEAAHGGPAR